VNLKKAPLACRKSVARNLRAPVRARQVASMRALVRTFAVLAFGLSACGGSKATPSTPVVAASAHTVSRPAPAPSAPPHVLARSTVRATVAQGLGALLQHVEFDDKPAQVGGKFHGFRIAALHDASWWNGVDVKVGDVITLVNGLPIERPEQAQRAFESLESASELRVSYERDSEPRELVYPIVDDR
jgi:type II secretory pathway component PulC